MLYRKLVVRRDPKGIRAKIIETFNTLYDKHVKHLTGC